MLIFSDILQVIMPWAGLKSFTNALDSRVMSSGWISRAYAGTRQSKSMVNELELESHRELKESIPASQLCVTSWTGSLYERAG